MTPVLVALAGGMGAATRFVLDGVIARHNPFRLPLGTLSINVIGSFVLGLLIGVVAAASHGPGGGSSPLVAVLGTGFCGGFTTFSTASVEAARLWITEGRATGTWYAVLTLIASIAAAAVGLALGTLIAGVVRP